MLPRGYGYLFEWSNVTVLGILFVLFAHSVLMMRKKVCISDFRD